MDLIDNPGVPVRQTDPALCNVQVELQSRLLQTLPLLEEGEERDYAGQVTAQLQHHLRKGKLDDF